jgi:hypothetical protein
MLENKILILADERVGTYSQAVALAKESGLNYEISPRKRATSFTNFEAIK